MKNSNRSGIWSSIRRSVSILLMFASLAVTNAAKAADLKNSPADGGTNINLTELSHRGRTFDVSQPLSGAASLNGNSRLVAMQVALYCYTNFGTFPMVVAVPPGSLCRVPLAFYPYVAFGTAW